jgi:hypothetical protein
MCFTNIKYTIMASTLRVRERDTHTYTYTKGRPNKDRNLEQNHSTRFQWEEPTLSSSPLRFLCRCLALPVPLAAITTPPPFIPCPSNFDQSLVLLVHGPHLLYLLPLLSHLFFLPLRQYMPGHPQKPAIKSTLASPQLPQWTSGDRINQSAPPL